MLNKINFVVSPRKIKELAYNDAVYAWLLLHSHYDRDENHNYIYENEFTFKQIAQDIHRHRDTVSKRFKSMVVDSREAIGNEFIIYYEDIHAYILPCFKEFEQLDADTVLNLFWLYGQRGASKKEELIKLYAWLKRRFKEGKKGISYEDILQTFDHAKGNESIYNRYKDLLTTLQGAGLIQFRTQAKSIGKFQKTFEIYKVNDKASQEWIDKKDISSTV